MIHFYAKRRVFMIISGIIFLAGIIAMFVNGVQLDIEFTGGSIIKYEFAGEINTEEVDSIATDVLGLPATCQITTDNMTEKQYLVVTLAEKTGISAQTQNDLTEAIAEKYPDANLTVYETSVVEPFIGARFLRNGIIAIVIAFVMIILYVWYAFRRIGGLSAGCMAMVALIHDCLVVFFAFVFFKIPLNENFIAAALSIIGFSVNDTIVIYDRIRENMNLYGNKMSIEDLVDKSITQSLTRSLNTNIAVFVSIAIVCVFAVIYGISSILSFALPMTLGVISGCYSTICIAGPLWVMWKKHKAKPVK